MMIKVLLMMGFILWAGRCLFVQVAHAYERKVTRLELERMGR